MRLQVPVDPNDARAAARRIVSGRRYRSAPTPRPFRKPLVWIGDRLAPIGRWFGRVFSHVPSGLLLLLAFVGVVAAITFAVVMVRARAGSP